MLMGLGDRLGAQGSFRMAAVPRILVAVAACVGALTSCGGDSGTSPRLKAPPPVSSIVLSRTVDSVEVNRTSTVAASALDSTGMQVTSATEAWSSGDTTVATVTPAGVITGVRAGGTTITVSTGTISAQLQLVVLPPAVATITFPTTSFTMTEGDSLTLPAPTIVDRTGAVVTNRSPTFTANSPNVTVSPYGVVAAVSAGSGTITATVDTAHTILTFTVNAAPIGNVKLVPSILDLGVGHTIATQASAYGVGGNRLKGHTFQYSTDNPSVATVSSTGIVTGVAPGKTTLSVSTGTGRVHVPISVAKIGIGGFLIDLHFVGDVPTSVRAAAQTAVTRWEQVISAPLIPYHIVVPAGVNGCGKGLPAVDTTETSVMVIIQVDSIDGYSNTVGLGGPCVIRDDSPQFTALGTLTIDNADIPSLTQQGILDATITHEIGHILGIGTLWGDPTIPAWTNLATGLKGTNPVFTGHAARVASAALGFTADSSQGVPIENTGGSGTEDSHWRESVFSHELMTGTLDNGLNPLSLVTIEALADFGYTVVPEAADDFSVLNANNPGGYVQPSLRIGTRIQERILLPRFTTTRSGKLKPIPGKGPQVLQQ